MALSSDPAPIVALDISESITESETSLQSAGMDNQDDAVPSGDLESSELQPVEARGEAIKSSASEVVVKSSPQYPPPLNAALKSQSSQIPSTEGFSFSAIGSVTKSFSSTPGYLANRLNAVNSSFSTPSSSHAAIFATPPM